MFLKNHKTKQEITTKGWGLGGWGKFCPSPDFIAKMDIHVHVIQAFRHSKWRPISYAGLAPPPFFFLNFFPAFKYMVHKIRFQVKVNKRYQIVIQKNECNGGCSKGTAWVGSIYTLPPVNSKRITASSIKGCRIWLMQDHDFKNV